jgi:hypothetical protein
MDSFWSEEKEFLNFYARKRRIKIGNKLPFGCIEWIMGDDSIFVSN